MRLAYLANIRLPTEKAHGLQIMKTCEALARQGVEVELIVPCRLNRLKDDPFAFYGVEKNFKITKVWCLDLISLKIFGKLGFWIESWTFYQSAKRYLPSPLEGGKHAVYYTRDLPIAYWLSKKVSPVYYEIHTLPDKVSSKHKEAWERCKGLVVISNGLRAGLLRWGIEDKKITIARDAVDPKQLEIFESKEECRKRLGLPEHKKIVLYTGHLYEWKGAGIVAESSRDLPEDTEVYLVGGTVEDVKRFRRDYNFPNLHIVGWQKHQLMPYWHKAADVLVVPTSAKTKIGGLYTSPLKVFEYMLAERLIVAADIPSIREILDESTAVFFVPDDPYSLAQVLKEKVLSSSLEMGEKARRAYELVLQKYTWDKRAEVIKNFISSHE